MTNARQGSRHLPRRRESICGSVRGSKSAVSSVDKATRRQRVGYIYVQSTGTDAQNDLMRQFMAQWKKETASSSTSAGTTAVRFPIASSSCCTGRSFRYWAVRDAPAQQWPPVAHQGAQVMLINGWSGSGGDAFPFYFRQAGLGPLDRHAAPGAG